MVVNIGAACFGLVIGWITYRTLRRRQGPVRLTDISTILVAVGGGAVTTVFGEPQIFGWYAIGLAVGFFGYLVVAGRSDRKTGSSESVTWMGDPN
ncbi:hypothetical protein ACIODS_33080 [Micromonospora chalcea]|uniref:hypothetical protein n=1 Tax=Micromonospora chalcea TaxID=1874 RepID=UPI00381B4897